MDEFKFINNNENIFLNYFKNFITFPFDSLNYFFKYLTTTSSTENEIIKDSYLYHIKPLFLLIVIFVITIIIIFNKNKFIKLINKKKQNTNTSRIARLEKEIKE